jgi:uncharacterized damage-inducible protein DinB
MEAPSADSMAAMGRRTQSGQEVAMGPVEYRALLRHMEWADSLTWKAALGVPSLQDDLELRERLHHFHSTQWAYLQLWRGEPLRVPELSSFADLSSLGRWARGYYLELPGYLEKLSEQALHGEVEFPWAAELAQRFGRVGPATLGDSMLQIVLHTTHHRAQVATRLRDGGGEPPMIDFIAWVWMHRPAPRWEGFLAA